jgi:hypothetical protein
MTELVLAKKPNLGQTVELEIIAADLTDSSCRGLDGNHDGQPGGNFVGPLSENWLAPADPSIRSRVNTPD